MKKPSQYAMCEEYGKDKACKGGILCMDCYLKHYINNRKRKEKRAMKREGCNHGMKCNGYRISEDIKYLSSKWRSNHDITDLPDSWCICCGRDMCW